MTNPDLKYRAFISYSHKDEKFGKWLHKALERYRVPKRLAAEDSYKGEIPRRIFPVFRDRDELPVSADLNKNIEEALHQSEFLIVICSPNSAKSRWVNEEIRQFKAMGRENKILALIIDGEPNASHKPDFDDSQECFPKALRYNIDDNGKLVDKWVEPIAADLRKHKDGKHRAKIKLIAGLLGLNFDSLWRREHRRIVRRRAIRVSIASILALALIIGGYLWWDYTRVKTGYYANMTFRWGVPEGIGRIDKETFSHRNYSYKFYSSRAKVDSVKRINSEGVPIAGPGNNNECKWLVQYLQDGKPNSILCKDLNSQIIKVKNYDYSCDPNKHYPDSMIIFFKNKLGGLLFTGEDYLSDRGKTSINRNLIVFDKNGYPKKKYFQSYSGKSVPDLYGSYGEINLYNERGLLKERSVMDFEGSIAQNAKGEIKIKYKYDSLGNVTEKRFTNKKNNPIVSREFRCSGIDYKYDEWGNNSIRIYLNNNGNKILNHAGVAISERTYDSKGNNIELIYYDKNKDITNSIWGYAFMKQEFDSIGNATRIEYFDKDQNPIVVELSPIDVDQVFGAIIEIESDSLGDYTQFSYFDVNGNALFNKFGISSIKIETNQEKNSIRDKFFGIDGKPILNRWGTAENEFIYDHTGQLIEQRYFGINSETINNIYGYHIVKLQYDDNGNKISESYFDIDNNPVLKNFINGQLGGYHKHIWEWDKNGNQKTNIFLDTDSNLVFNSQNFAIWRAKYDEFGHQVELAYYGNNEEPVNGPEGYFKFKTSFSSKGDSALQEYYDVNNQPTKNLDGCYKKILLKDKMENNIEERYMDGNGKLMISNLGSAIVRAKYDLQGHRIEKTNYGLQGERICDKYMGAHKVTAEYDILGNTIEIAFWDTQGKAMISTNFGYHKGVQIFDEYYRKKETSFYDTDNNPICSKQGYAKEMREYNIHHDVTSFSYFDEENNPVNTLNEYHKKEVIYNDLWQPIEYNFYNAKNKLINTTHVKD